MTIQEQIRNDYTDEVAKMVVLYWELQMHTPMRENLSKNSSKMLIALRQMTQLQICIVNLEYNHGNEERK